MSYSTYAIKWDDLKKFITNGRIKTPKDIAGKLKVSQRTALRLISHLKENGIKINIVQRKKGIKYLSKK